MAIHPDTIRNRYLPDDAQTPPSATAYFQGAPILLSSTITNEAGIAELTKEVALLVGYRHFWV